MKKYFVFLMAVAVMIVAGCKSNDDVKVTGVTLDQTTAEVKVTQDLILVATVAPADADNKKVTWSSSDDAIASVSNNGIVKGEALGTATITVKTECGGFTATCEVTVVPNVAVAVTGVSLGEIEGPIETARKLTLVATITPANATNRNVTWASSDATTVSVTAGVIEGLKPGTATITATSVENPDHSATLTVTVTEDFLVEDFEWDEVGKNYPMFAFNGDSNGIREVILDPHGDVRSEGVDDDGDPIGIYVPSTDPPGPGKALRIHGENLNAQWGSVGIMNFVELTVVLPEGKKLGDYTSLTLDMFFFRGSDTFGAKPAEGDPVPGTSSDGAGWYGWGAPGLFFANEDHESRLESVPGFEGNTKEIGTAQLRQRGEILANEDWHARYWLRDYKYGLNNVSDEAKEFTEFKIRFGCRSGAVNFAIDNIILRK